MNMTDSNDKEHPRNIDVRRNAGIVRSPPDEIKAIQPLLADVYTDAGDGRTLFHELFWKDRPILPYSGIETPSDAARSANSRQSESGIGIPSRSRRTLAWSSGSPGIRTSSTPAAGGTVLIR